jgi:hypothetical protein
MIARQDIFRAIADPELYQQQEADDRIRRELVKIKASKDQIDRLTESLPLAAQREITSLAADLEHTAITIADELDDLQQQQEQR